MFAEVWTVINGHTVEKLTVLFVRRTGNNGHSDQETK